MIAIGKFPCFLTFKEDKNQRKIKKKKKRSWKMSGKSLTKNK